MHSEALFDSAWSALVNPPSINEDLRVKAAEEFKNTAEAKDGSDYDWAYDYAKEVYAQKMATRDSNDAKAGEIIKYLGGGTGLFTLAALLNVTPANRSVLWFILPSFFCTLASLFFAILARRPNDVTVPPTAEGAKEYADAFKTERNAKAAFIGQWHLAAERQRALNEIAAHRIGKSIQLMFWAIASLLVPVLAVMAR